MANRIRKGRTPSRRETSRIPETAPSCEAKAAKYVYYFGDGKADGDGNMKPLLGGKGANLAEMTRIGLPVPPGLHDHDRSLHLLSTRTSAPIRRRSRRRSRSRRREHGKNHGHKIRRHERDAAARLRPFRRARFHAGHDGHDSQSRPERRDRARARREATKNERFAWDCYRRFIQMYGDVVMGVQKRAGEDHEPFEIVIEHFKHERYGKHDIDDTKLSVADLKELVTRFKEAGQRTHRQSISRTIRGSSSEGAIGAVFGSWMNDRAIVYRRKYNIPQEWGTAVNVQAMVYGNTGDNSGSGVAFTREPGHRRESVLRRISDQRAGRRRRRRRAHSAAGRRT